MNPASLTTDTVSDLMERARTLLDLGRPGDALPLLHQALAGPPDQEYEAMCLLSVAHGARGDDRESLAWSERAVGTDPDYWWAYQLCACSLGVLGRKEEALEAALEAVRLDPENTDALATLARMEIAVNDLDGASETLEYLRRLDPDGHQTHDLFGHAALQRLQGPEAVLYFRRALAVQPDSAEALFKLGVLLHHGADTHDEAVGDAQVREAIDCLYHAARLGPTEEVMRHELLDALETLLIVKPMRIIQAMTTLVSLFLIRGLLLSPWAAGNWLLGFIDWYLIREVFYCLRKSGANFRTLAPPVQDFWRRFGVGPVRRYPWT